MAQAFFAFSGGFAVALVIGAIARMLLGLKLNLYFIHREPGTHKVTSSSLIPITAPNRKSSIVRSLREGRWREDQDLQLGDYQGRHFTFRIGYHFWYRFYLILETPNPKLTPRGDACVKLGSRTLKQGKRYPLRSGARLQTGDRAFEIHVTPAQLEDKFHRELSAA